MIAPPEIRSLAHRAYLEAVGDPQVYALTWGEREHLHTWIRDRLQREIGAIEEHGSTLTRAAPRGTAVVRVGMDLGLIVSVHHPKWSESAHKLTYVIELCAAAEAS